MVRYRALIMLVCLCAVARSAPAEYREEAVVNGGTISGRVLAAGEVPKLPPQPVFKEMGVCGKTAPDDRLVVGSGGALENAVVHLVGVTVGKPIPRDQPVVLDNRQCRFVPHVTTGSVGQTLEIRNDDPFMHDAHAWLGTMTVFNVGILKGHTAKLPLNDPGLLHINCNVRHTWMHAYLFVGEDPYHAVTGEGGRYVIDQVPPGIYTVRVWHEMLGGMEQTVTVEAGKTVTVDFALPVSIAADTVTQHAP